MKKIAVVLICMMVVSVAAVAADNPAAALYKTKCQACHGADGTTAKGNIKSFKDPSVQKMSDADLEKMIGEGGAKALASHQFSKKGLKPEEIKGLAGYVKTLGK